MRVIALKALLSGANDDDRVVVQHGNNVFETEYAEMAPSGNVFIHFDDWYDKKILDNRWIPVTEEIPKMEERVLVKTFGITTIAMRVSPPNAPLKFSVVDPITNNLVYDAADHYQIREWRKMPT